MKIVIFSLFFDNYCLFATEITERQNNEDCYILVFLLFWGTMIFIISLWNNEGEKTIIIVIFQQKFGHKQVIKNLILINNFNLLTNRRVCIPPIFYFIFILLSPWCSPFCILFRLLIYLVIKLRKFERNHKLIILLSTFKQTWNLLI